jgi:hypothetical protein
MTTPSRWANVEVIEGLDIVDKTKLIGVPFCILGATFKSNNSGVQTCYIDAEYENGDMFTFTDSSTGVAAQIKVHLAEKQLDHIISEEGEYADFMLLAPRGLRVSEYDRQLRTPNGAVIPNKTAPAKTYYISTSGERNAKTGVAKPKSAPKSSK